jgi:hypothetical protein
MAATRSSHPGGIVHVLVWLGVVLLVLWAVLWLGFKIVSGIVHLLVIAAVVCIIWGLVKKGARAVGKRM